MPRKRHAIHHSHFIILLIILGIGAAAILLTTYYRPYQIAAVILTSLAYFSWGIIHHYKQKELHSEIIIEYLLIAIFGAVLLISVILKA